MLKTKEQKAITRIALIITIIILIILASVAIYLSLGNNGIFTKAKELTNKQEATDIINLKITTAQMNKYSGKQEMPTLKELSEILKEDDEIQYVTEKSKIASTKYEVSENPTSIFTKLNQYPYEFEINSSLQLASINGVKLASKDDKSEIIFIGNLNSVINNNGVVTTEFDIKEIYADYKNITIDNFVYKFMTTGMLIME